jgi:hypothetical protein
MVRQGTTGTGTTGELEALFSLADVRIGRVRDAERELHLARELAAAVVVALRLEVASRLQAGEELPRAMDRLAALEDALGLVATKEPPRKARSGAPPITRESDQQVLAFLDNNRGWWRPIDIAHDSGLNRNTVRASLGRLRRAGYLHVDERGPRYAAGDPEEAGA